MNPFPRLGSVVCASSLALSATALEIDGVPAVPAKKVAEPAAATISAYPKKAVFPKVMPAAVAAYRAELEKPGALAAAILSAASEMRGDRCEEARAEIAFAAMWTDAELDKILAAKIKEVRARAEAASARKAKAGEDEEALTKAAHEAAPEWFELSRLHAACGEDREASEAATQRLEALSEAAIPQEWLDASLAAVPLLARAGKAKDAEQLLEKCKTLRTKADELRNSEIAEANLLLAEARLRSVPPRGRAALARPQTRGEAASLYSQATGLLEKTLGGKHSATVTSLEEWLGTPEPAKAEEMRKLCERLLAVREELLGPDHPATIRAVAILSNQLPEVEADMAHRLAKRVTYAWMQGAGLGRPARLGFAQNTVKECAQRGEPVDSEKINRALFTASSEVLGPNDRQTLWHGGDLAIALGNLGDSAAAEKVNREVWAAREKSFGPNDGDTLTSMNNTAVSISGQGRYREALELYEKTFALRTKESGENDLETLRTQSNIASIRHTLGDFEAAEKLHSKTYEARAKIEVDSVDALRSKQEIARLALDRGEVAKAAAACEEVAVARGRLQGADHPSTLGTLLLQGKILLAQGKTAEAVAQLRSVLEKSKTRLGTANPAVQSATLALGEALVVAGDLANAEPLLRGVLEAIERRLGQNHADTLEAVVALAEALLKKRDFAAAEPLLRRALEGFEKALDPQHPLVGKTSEILAAVLEGKGDKAGALTLAERAQTIAQLKLVKTAPVRLRTEALVKHLRE